MRSRHIRNGKNRKTAIITDDIVDRLYGKAVVDSLESSGFTVCKFVFKNGEGSKSTETLNEIYNFLCENNITRTDCVIALGGGRRRRYNRLCGSYVFKRT